MSSAVEQHANFSIMPGHHSVSLSSVAVRPSISQMRQTLQVPEAKRLESGVSYGQVEQFAREHPQDIEALRIYTWRIGAPGAFAYMISPVTGFDTEADYLLSQVRSYFDIYAPQGKDAASSPWETQQILHTPLSSGWKMTEDGWEINAPEEYRQAREKALAIKRQHEEDVIAQETAREAERAAYEVPLGTDIFGTVLPLAGNVTKMAAIIQRDSRRAQEAGEPIVFNQRVDAVAHALHLDALHERNSVARVATFITEFSSLVQSTDLTVEQVQGVFAQVTPVVRDVIARGSRADLEHLWFVFTRDSREPMPRQDAELQAALVDRIDRAEAALADKIAQKRVGVPYVPDVSTPKSEATVSLSRVLTPHAAVVPSVVAEQTQAEAPVRQRHWIRLFGRRNRPAAEPKSPPRFYFGWRENPDPQYDEARMQH